MNFLRFLIFVYLIISNFANAQNSAEVKGYFLSDSAMAGEHVAYSLCVKYPAKFQVFFPDTIFNYAPFELVKKEFFYTKNVKNDFYTDSAIYYMRNFEIENLSTYSLPVYLYNNNDTISIYANIDTLYFKSVLPDSLKTTKLMINTQYADIPLKPNIVFYLFLILVIVLILISLWLFFGKSILRWYYQINTKRRHSQFLKNYISIKNNILENDNIESWSQLLAIWKKHVSLLNKHSIESLTTREICIELNDNSIKKPLQQIDNRIYGNIKIEIESNTQALYRVAVDLYQKTIKEKQ